MKVKIKRVHPDAKIPEYKTSGAAGCDIYTIEKVNIKPGESLMLRTGLAFEFPKNYFLMIAPRSSFALKNNLDIPNSIAIGDADYRGEYLLAVRNLGGKEITIEKHERIGQVLFIPIEHAEFLEVEELTESKRGSGSFGSTGKF